jgi:hypothetical protein
MFPCGHVHYSLLRRAAAPPLQIVGSILPDAATTSAFSWTELHLLPRVKSFAAFASGDPSLEPLISGIRHHVELDGRAHEAWGEHEAGYAYSVQTPELRALVKKALSCDDARARIVAHNFIESACDIHIAATSDAFDQLVAGLDVVAIERASKAVAEWLDADVSLMQARVAEFYDLWRAPFTTVDTMTAQWLSIVPHINESAFNGEIGAVDEAALRAGLELSVELVADSFDTVLTP